jgi:hypothetical protein
VEQTLAQAAQESSVLWCSLLVQWQENRVLALEQRGLNIELPG